MFLKAKITNFSYFKNFKESMVFTKEQQKTSGLWPVFDVVLNHGYISSSVL
jgi:hypothetical protein